LTTRPYIEFRDKKGELVSAANQLKLTAADGKEYRTDTFDYDGIIALAKNFLKSDRIIVEVERIEHRSDIRLPYPVIRRYQLPSKTSAIAFILSRSCMVLA